MASPQMTVNIAGTVPLPTGGATAAKQDTQITAEQAILAKLSSDPATQTTLAAVLAKLSADPATQTTLAAILAKLIAAPATETKQDTQITAEQAILAKLSSDPATQTTLAAILAKIIAAPATEASLALINAVLGTTAGAAIITDATGTAQQYLRGLVKLWIAGLPAGTAAIGTVQIGNTQNTTPILASPLGFAVDVTLTRPNDSNAYAANDEISSSTSAPAVNTITGAARASGGMCRLRAASCVDSSNVATKAQLLVFVFDTTTTPANDNAAFAPADSVMNTCVAVLPFNVWYPGDDTSGATGNAFSPYLGPEIDIKTVGSANLFFRVKVLNAYAPTAQEALVFRFDFVQY